MVLTAKRSYDSKILNIKYHLDAQWYNWSRNEIPTVYKTAKIVKNVPLVSRILGKINSLNVILRDALDLNWCERNEYTQVPFISFAINLMA